MDLWFTEKQQDDLSLSCSVERVLLYKKTEYQEIAILDTGPLGRILVIDGFIQTTTIDEFIYHEMIAHVPLVTHPNPKDVLIIGGGDGGTVREVVKHKGVDRVTLVEIDREVVAASKEYLPELSLELHNPRVKVEYTDGIAFVANSSKEFDVVIVDSTEPVGPAAGLFTREFYASVFNALKDGGVVSAQTESPFYNQDIISTSVKYLKEYFPIAKLYLSPVPSYPGGLWSFVLGSKKYLPDNSGDNELNKRGESIKGCRYYNPAVHLAAFVLPPFVWDMVK